MTKQDYVKQQVKSCMEQWFPLHTVTAMDDLSLRWQKPKNSAYWIEYILRRNYLIVIGDVGEAIYQWSQHLTWDFLKTLDLDYFVGKCQASEVGRPFTHWEPDVAKAWAKDFTDHANVSYEDGTFSHRQEFSEHLRDNEQTYGADWYEYLDVGEVLHPRAIGHWVGLQMALQGTPLKRYL